MKVVVVCSVVVRPQYRAEAVTGCLLHLTKEFRFLPTRLPVPRKDNALAVSQAKATDVQGIGRGVLAQPALLAVVDIAAGKTAQMVDLCHRLPKHPLRRRLQTMFFEQCVRHRQRTTGQKAAAEPRLTTFDTPYVP